MHFCIYAEFQNGKKTIFGKKCQMTLHIHCVFAFYAEFQDGHQKWQENNFWQKVPDDCIHPVGQKISLKMLYLATFLR